MVNEVNCHSFCIVIYSRHLEFVFCSFYFFQICCHYVKKIYKTIFQSFLINKFIRLFCVLQICKLIVDTFTKYQLEPTSDPVIMNGLMFLARIMHDSVNALSLEDEKRYIGQLVCGFLKKVCYFYRYAKSFYWFS